MNLVLVATPSNLREVFNAFDKGYTLVYRNKTHLKFIKDTLYVLKEDGSWDVSTLRIKTNPESTDWKAYVLAHWWDYYKAPCILRVKDELSYLPYRSYGGWSCKYLRTLIPISDVGLYEKHYCSKKEIREVIDLCASNKTQFRLTKVSFENLFGDLGSEVAVCESDCTTELPLVLTYLDKPKGTDNDTFFC